MDIPTSKSCKPLIAEDDCSPTADYYLQVPYMPHAPNRFLLTSPWSHDRPSSSSETNNMDIPTSKSGKPLIAEDDYELTAVSSPKVNRFLLISPSPVIVYRKQINQVHRKQINGYTN